MAGALRKTMVYLGLAEDVYGDEVYDEYDEPDQAYAQAARREPHRSDAHRSDIHRSDIHRSDIHRSEGGQVTAFPTRSLSQVPTGGGMQRITTIHPRTYNDAKTIGEAFRDGIPVIMNLTDMGDADAKRLVDFAAGLVFGLHGAIERVTAKVFLLSPSHVEVMAEDKDDETVPGPFNQS